MRGLRCALFRACYDCRDEPRGVVKLASLSATRGSDQMKYKEGENEGVKKRTMSSAAAAPTVVSSQLHKLTLPLLAISPMLLGICTYCD